MNEFKQRLRTSRLVLMALIFVAPLIAGPYASLIALSLAATLTAYDGIRSSTVYALLTALVCLELVFGYDVGILGLSYLVAVLALMPVQRVIALTPWGVARGWHISDALRTLCVTYGLCLLMLLSEVGIGAVLYGYAHPALRLSIVLVPIDMLWTALGIAATLVVLRRIDEPFRRRISFGM